MNLKDNSFSVCAWLMLSLIIVGSYGCSSSTDSYRPFVNKEIPVYPQKLDTVIAQAGKRRVIFKIPKPPDPIVKKVGIFWNNGTDSLITYFQDNKDTLFVEIDTLREQDYSFNFLTFDADGNESLKRNILVQIYGSQYESSLSNRPLNGYLYQPGSSSQNSIAVLEWGAVSSEVIGTKVKYTNQFDESDSVFTPADSSQTILKNFKLGNNSAIKYRTLYLPNPTAIDTFLSNTASTSGLTGIKLYNSGPNFNHEDWDGERFGNLKGWSANEALKNQNGYGGYDGDYADEGQLNIRQWEQGRPDKMKNGKLYQTVTLPKGSYTFKIFISENSYMNYGQSVTDLVVAKGETLPDISELDSKALKFKSVSKENISFELNQQTQVSIGFVSTLTSYSQQLEVKKVRLIVNN